MVRVRLYMLRDRRGGMSRVRRRGSMMIMVVVGMVEEEVGVEEGEGDIVMEGVVDMAVAGVGIKL